MDGCGRKMLERGVIEETPCLFSLRVIFERGVLGRRSNRPLTQRLADGDGKAMTVSICVKNWGALLRLLLWFFGINEATCRGNNEAAHVYIWTDENTCKAQKIHHVEDERAG